MTGKEPRSGEEPLVEREHREDRVEVPRSALLGLVVLAVGALLAVAFLLGRESARPEPPAPTAWRQEAPAPAPSPSPSPPPVASAPPQPPPARPEPPAAAPVPPPPRTVQASRVASVDPGVPAIAPPAVAEAPPPVDPAEREQVSRYFQALEASVGGAAAWQDPQGMANSVLEQGAQGDSSGFDRLLHASRQALARVQAVPAPESCRQHHQLTVQIMESGLGLLQRMRQATLSGDSSALMALAAEGQELQARVQRLEALQTSLKGRYGL